MPFAEMDLLKKKKNTIPLFNVMGGIWQQEIHSSLRYKTVLKRLMPMPIDAVVGVLLKGGVKNGNGKPREDGLDKFLAVF